MRTKERELLKRVLIGDDDGDFFLSHGLYKEIQELLAQPEHIVDVTDKVAPVAWMYEGYENDLESTQAYCGSEKPFKGEIKQPFNLRPLYTAPPKQEPLSDLDVFTLYEEAEYIGFLAYRKGIKGAEKAHGIGGGE